MLFRSMLEDHRLSLDARAVAAYICTRSDTFDLSVAGLCVLLEIGEDKWRRIRDELHAAGYLRHIKGKDQRGRFRHELLFSPIPTGGFPERRTRRVSKGAKPKNPACRGMANPGAAQPRSAEPGATRKRGDRISEYQHPTSVGVPDSIDSEPPPIWIEAANYEISVESETRRVRNRGGLFKAILDRYRAEGGPDGALLDALQTRKVVEAKRAAEADAAREQAGQEAERAGEDAQRLASAEVVAKEMNPEQRARLVEALEGRGGLFRVGRIAREAFVNRGDILRGPLRRVLVQVLMSG